MQFDTAEDDPIGIVDFVNCPCGTTLSVRWEGPPGTIRQALRLALEDDALSTSKTMSELLLDLRSAVRGRVVSAR
jgi:hypothetical protein